MNKAFTKEDSEEEVLPIVAVFPELPSGVVNYITAEGMARFQQTIAELQQKPAPTPEDLTPEEEEGA